ncbi:MAG TPA: hypothetical protein VKQ72_03485 [Aggregatilineales bacterium]|nr:hypothetical protein [Aggregatilineales bacterium]
MNNAVRIDRRALIVLLGLVLLTALTLTVGSVMRAGAASRPAAAVKDCVENCPPPPVTCGTATDGRMDPVCQYPDQSTAVYCTEDGGVDLYSVLVGSGRFDFHVTPEELAASLNPTVNTLIAQGANSQGILIRLYRLTDNQLEIVSPLPKDPITGQTKMFVFVWDGC